MPYHSMQPAFRWRGVYLTDVCYTNHIWNAKAETIQDIENHMKTTVLNQENSISYPKFLYITARNSIHVQDVVNVWVKMKIYMQE